MKTMKLEVIERGLAERILPTFEWFPLCHTRGIYVYGVADYPKMYIKATYRNDEYHFRTHVNSYLACTNAELIKEIRKNLPL